ncbi:MAG: pitrilysin family protein [Bdellovibrionales bacterium]
MRVGSGFKRLALPLTPALSPSRGRGSRSGLSSRFYLRLVLPALFTAALPGAAQAAVFNPTSFTLANGLQVIVVPNHLAPVVNQMVWYKVGAADEVPGKTGLAHYLEHLMFRGTRNVAPGDFSKLIAAQGGNDNAFTSWDYTAYFETVAADRLPMIMGLEADRMRHLRVTPETATPELQVVLSERQQRTDNDPHGRFNEEVRRALLPRHPYGVPVIGWRKDIEKLSVADAEKFYRRHYAPNNAVVVISGDVKPETVMRLAASIYGPIPKSDVPPRRSLPSAPMPTKERLRRVDPGIDLAQIQINAVVPSRTTQKGREAYAFEVLSEVLDSGEVGLLYRHLVQDKAIASGIGASYDPDSRGDALFSIAASPAPKTRPKVLETALQEELRALAQQGLEPALIEAAKARLIRAAIFARDSLMAPGYVFGSALATGRSVADVEDWPARIEAVTVDEVNAALRAMESSPRKITALLLPDPKGSGSRRSSAAPVSLHDGGSR